MNKPNAASNIKKRLSVFWQRLSHIKIRGIDVIVTLSVLILSCLIIVPSIVQCVSNRTKAACEAHMSRMLSMLSGELSREEQSGGTYWHDLIINGNYQKLISSLTEKTGESKKYPASNYYIRTGDDKITMICKEHNDISEKELSFSKIQNVNVSVAEKPLFGGRVAYLAVSGPDTYYQYDSLDASNPDKMIFSGIEADKVIQNLKVYATYIGGYREELPRSRYTVSCDTLDMSKATQVKLIIKSNKTSVWDNSSYVPFVIDIVGEEDVAPLIVDAGRNGRFELAAWDWSDYVEEASEMDGAEEFGASIIRYNGKYYYYPDGLKIVNDRDNTNPFEFALDTGDENKSAYYIEFDTNSVILNSSDEEKKHNGSLKADNDFVYIWQDTASKELPEGWIRVYCELKKY